MTLLVLTYLSFLFPRRIRQQHIVNTHVLFPLHRPVFFLIYHPDALGRPVLHDGYKHPNRVCQLPFSLASLNIQV